VTDNRDPIRHVRIAESLWRAAQRAVVKRGDASVSHIIRRALVQYVSEDTDRTGGPARRPGRTPPDHNRGANRNERDDGP